jgi:hypothetical protein
MKTGREGMLTPKDEKILLDLFFCRYLTTAQIAALYYNSTRRASTRLYQLKKKGVLDSRVIYTTAPTRDHPGKREAVWHLTKDAFEMVAASLDLEEDSEAKATWTPKQLGPEKTRDHVKVNQLYVAAKADLDGLVGPYPAWTWEHEKWATDPYRYSGRPMVHKPDAHVRLYDTLFVVERQTKESRVRQTDVADKVSSHATWARVRLGDANNTQVLFACDERRVAEAARRAGERYGIYVFAGSVEEAAFHLYQSALRLMPGRNGEAGEGDEDFAGDAKLF